VQDLLAYDVTRKKEFVKKVCWFNILKSTCITNTVVESAVSNCTNICNCVLQAFPCLMVCSGRDACCH